MKSKTAFTKRDLVVTLGCIVFLLANFAAVGSRGRQRAKEAVCLSNLRKWGTVFHAFAADNDGFFMEGRSLDPWWLALEPYYKNRELLCCPMANNPDLPAWPNTYHSGNFGTWPHLWFPDPKGGPDFYGSYGINEWVCNPYRVAGQISPAEFKITGGLPTWLVQIGYHFFWTRGGTRAGHIMMIGFRTGPANGRVWEGMTWRNSASSDIVGR